MRIVRVEAIGQTPLAISNLRCAVRQKSIPFARFDTLFKESSLHGVPRERDRCPEVFLRHLPSSSAKFELAECRGIKWIVSEAIVVCNRVDLFKPSFGTIALCDRDRTIQRYHR